MATVQSTYTETIAAAVLGALASSDHHELISRTVEDSAGLAFGKIACQGTGDNGVTAPAAATYTAAVAADGDNTGNGTFTVANPAVGAGVKAGEYVVTIVDPASDAGTFTIEDPDGVQIDSGAVASAYDGVIKFTLADGATDFAAGDRFVVTVTAAGEPVFRGVTVRDQSQPPEAADKFRQYDSARLLIRGVLWVTAGANVAAGEPAYFVPSSGAITNVAEGNVRIPGGIFDSTAQSAALVKLRIA
jgi:hypothetical protein